MNRSNQNNTPSGYQRTGPDYGGSYLARPNGMNTVASFLPIYLPGGPLDPREGNHDPRRSFRERTPSGSFGISSFPAPQHFPNQTQFLHNDATRNTRPRQPAIEASPSFQRQQNLQAPGEESRLRLVDQKKELNKLKKEIYNPMPKWLARKPNLYYRDDPITIARETEKKKDEDGKRCAICLEDFEPNEMVTITPCNHMFHEECVIPWLKSQGQCPVCRFVICEKSAAPSSNTTANDLFQSDLIAIITAMGEAFLPQNMRRIL